MEAWTNTQQKERISYLVPIPTIQDLIKAVHSGGSHTQYWFLRLKTQNRLYGKKQGEGAVVVVLFPSNTGLRGGLQNVFRRLKAEFDSDLMCYMTSPLFWTFPSFKFYWILTGDRLMKCSEPRLEWSTYYS